MDEKVTFERRLKGFGGRWEPVHIDNMMENLSADYMDVQVVVDDMVKDGLEAETRYAWYRVEDGETT